jgi:hypothetical protein
MLRSIGISTALWALIDDPSESFGQNGKDQKAVNNTLRGILLNTTNSHRSSFHPTIHSNSKDAIQLHSQPSLDPIARTYHSGLSPRQPVQRIHQRLASARAANESLVLCCLLLLRPGATLPCASPRVGQPRSILYLRFRGRRSGIPSTSRSQLAPAQQKFPGNGGFVHRSCETIRAAA